MKLKVRQKKRSVLRQTPAPRPGTKLRFIAVFQLLIWWGAEVVQNMFTHRRTQGKIVRTERASCPFPRSAWVLTKEGAYCLVDQSKTHSVEIHPGSPFSLN